MRTATYIVLSGIVSAGLAAVWVALLLLARDEEPQGWRDDLEAWFV